MKVYILLDLDSEGKDIVWGVYSTYEAAMDAEDSLNRQRWAGAATEIVEHEINEEYS